MTGSARIYLVAILLGWLLMACVRASDVWFQDIYVRSANGLYAISAESPENRRRHPEPFQSDFVYTLRETSSGEVLWRLKQGSTLTPGGPIFLSNSGRALLLNGSDRLIVVQKNGRAAALVIAHSLIPKSELSRYADETSVGLQWRDYASEGTWDVNGGDYFHLRTYWGRHILVDLEHAKVSRRKDVIDAIEQALLAKSISTAATPSDQLTAACSNCSGRHISSKVGSGLFVLAKHRPADAKRLAARIRKADPAFSGFEKMERFRPGLVSR